MANSLDRIQITYDLSFETLFHFGTGIRRELIDRTVVRDDKGYLYVPGSTFKGVLRERCEQLARFYELEGQQDIASPHDATAALQEFDTGRLRLLTHIFGSHKSPGRLFFDDARQEEESLSLYDSGDEEGKYKRELQIDLYTQVRLARPTRTAVQGALYTSEFGTRDIVFKGFILGWLEHLPIDPQRYPELTQADPAPTFPLLLLLAGLRLVDRLGGNKSTGKGKCRCEVTGLQINGQECIGSLESLLEQIDALATYNEAREG